MIEVPSASKHLIIFCYANHNIQYAVDSLIPVLMFVIFILFGQLGIHPVMLIFPVLDGLLDFGIFISNLIKIFA
jgi:hypothetical protein